jgi:hypothetical protein
LGNFGPFFEAGIGASLDGRNRMYWLISLLILTYLLNMLICTKALINLLGSRVTGRKHLAWLKTGHTGGGNYLG